MNRESARRVNNTQRRTEKPHTHQLTLGKIEVIQETEILNKLGNPRTRKVYLI